MAYQVEHQPIDPELKDIVRPSDTGGDPFVKLKADWAILTDANKNPVTSADLTVPVVLDRYVIHLFKYTTTSAGKTPYLVLKAAWMAADQTSGSSKSDNAAMAKLIDTSDDEDGVSCYHDGEPPAKKAKATAA